MRASCADLTCRDLAKAPGQRRQFKKVTKRSIVLFWAAVLCIVAPYLNAHAQQALDEGVRVQLQRLKELCDEGLIAQQVCDEKQRQILGLSPSTEAAGSVIAGRERAQEAIRGFLGIVVGPVPTDASQALDLDIGEGVVVVSVLEDGPAEQAGLSPRDVIVALDQQPIRSVDAFSEIEAALLPSSEMSIEVLRTTGGRAVLDITAIDRTQYPPERSYTSPFGYQVTLPAGWRVISAPELERGKEFLSEKLPADAQMILDFIPEGEVLAKGSDLVTVVDRTASLPENLAVLRPLCGFAATTRSNATGRRIQTHYCGSTTTVDMPAFCMELDAVFPGKRTRECWIARPETGTLMFSMTFVEQLQQQRIDEFEQIIGSIEWR